MIAVAAATLALLVAGPTLPAYAGETPNADQAEGTTICGSYKDGGSGYGYNFEKDIKISAAGWNRLLANDPYGLKVSANIWSKILPTLGKTFPLNNWSKVELTTLVNPLGNVVVIPSYTNLNTSMNNATCGSTFEIGAPKSQSGAVGGPLVLSAGHMKVIEMRTNGITFIGTEGIMKNCVMNFRIRSGVSKTFLNIHTTGPALPIGVQDGARWFMEFIAEGTWQSFADRIGAAQ